MPLYEYQCKKCKHRFEKIRKFSDPPLTNCPKCDGLVEQLLSAPAVQFKGSGWYVTDYARGGRASSKSEGPDSSKDGSSKDSSKEGAGSPAKTAEKADSKKTEKTPEK